MVIHRFDSPDTGAGAGGTAGPTPNMLKELKQQEEMVRGLSRDQAIQTIAVHVRRDLMQALASQQPEADRKEGDQKTEADRKAEKVAATFRMHGDPTHHPEILSVIADLERAKRNESPDDLLMKTVRLLWNRLAAEHGEKRSATSIERFRDRLLAGEKMRDDNTDLSPEEWDKLERSVGPEHSGLVQQMRRTNLALREKLDQHPKFKGMLNANAFERDFDASNEPGTFVFFDLINFKNFNSRYTYDFVDEMIMERVCDALKTKLPPGAMAGIKAGDEFLVFLPGMGNEREAVTVIADALEKTMQSISLDDVRMHEKLLTRKPKGIVGIAKDLVTRASGGNPDDPAAQAKRTAAIKKDLESLHGKMVAVRREPGMAYTQAQNSADEGQKSLAHWHYRSNYRFPSTVVKQGKSSKAFSATGVEEKSFVRGAINDARDLWGRLTR